MKTKRKNNGLTLTETTIVVAIVALMAFLGLPAIKTFFNSLGSPAGVKSMINAAMSTARAIAARDQKYAGIRFQQDIDGNQYMIFIVNEEPANMGGLDSGFRVVQGLKPVKLPENLTVMDMELGSASPATPISLDGHLLNSEQLTDTTTFSIIFSPSGKLVVRNVRVRNRDGQRDTSANVLNTSNDDVFNKKDSVDDPLRPGMFYQDDYIGDGSNVYPNLGLGEERSRTSFKIYDVKEFEKAYRAGTPVSGYLVALPTVFINSYTGRTIKTD